MIMLIHGDDQIASRNKLLEEKTLRKDNDIRMLDGTKLDLASLSETLSSPTLFALPQTIIIENLLSSQKSKMKDENIKLLFKSEDSHTVILWEKTQVSKTILTKYFSKTNVYAYVYPKILFTFLDSIGQATSEKLLSLFRTLIKETDAEMIFAMLIRQWRFLLLASEGRGENLSDLSPWQARKFLTQVRFFTQEKLIQSYRQLLSIDSRIKSGTTPLTLTQLLDIFLVTL